MAKEFKDFDKMFSKAEIAAVRKVFLGAVSSEVLGMIKDWIHKDKIGVWSNETIRECVYLLDDSVEWQKFRVSLKGLTTREKLYMLERRWYIFGVGECVGEHWRIEKCRIDNYIGALVRGGQLAVGTYEVLK